jgi:hypothetical protein
LVAVEVRKANESRYRFVGFQLPWLVIGPVRVKGLLRELYRPLSYGLESTVFRETTEVGLDGSFSGGSRNGVFLAPLPGTWGLFFLESRGILKSGSLVVLPSSLAASGWELVLLLAASRPARHRAPASWFVVGPRFPGGWLVHEALRLRYRSSSLDSTFSLGLSGGDRIGPGFFSHLLLEAREAPFSIDFLMGQSSSRYCTPDGLRNSIAICAAFRVGWQVTPTFSLSGDYRFEQAQLFEAVEGLVPSSETVGLALTGRSREEGGGPFDAWMKWRRSYGKEEQSSRRLGGSVTLFSQVLSVELERRDEELLMAAKISLSPAFGRLSFSVEKCTGNPAAFSLEVSLGGGDKRLAIRGDVNGESPGFRLGWKTLAVGDD